MRTFVWIVIGLAGLCTAQPVAGNPVDSVLDRYRNFLLETMDMRGAPVESWVRNLKENGRWSDIDYQDQERAGWKTLDHLRRVDSLCIAWSDPHTGFYHRSDVWHAIDLSLNDWLRHQYQNPNWWHNQIGVPQLMRDVLVLVRKQLSEEELKEGLQVMGQLKVQGSGANLTWSADLGFHYGALKGDTILMDSCRALILKEIYIGTGEGIQPDYSFHQHGPRLQMYQYGKAFLFSNIRLAWELTGSPWAFPEDKVKILTDFLLKGWQWMARGVNTVPGTMDRSSSRVGELRSPDIRLLIPMLLELDPRDAASFRLLKAHQDGRGSLSGFRYYPYSDFAAYQTADFSFFLKTISSRTLPSEVGLNSENLKGHLLNSGDAYLISNGEEYYDLMPVWNWEALPGITAFKGAEKMDKQPFVGSVSDGASGLTAMDYRMLGKDPDQWLHAHKTWICHDGLVICLVSGLEKHPLSLETYTALDQSRLQGPVMAAKPPRTLSRGTDTLQKVAWLYHHGFVYMPLGASTIRLKADSAWGRWSDINTSSTDKLVKDSVFLPILIPDTSAANTAFGYVLGHAKTAKRAMQLYRSPSWKILQNDTVCQAVLWKDKTLMTAFFSPGHLRWGNSEGMSVDRPCLVMLAGSKVFVSDPAHRGGMVQLQLNHQRLEVQLKPDGTTTEASWEH